MKKYILLFLLSIFYANGQTTIANKLRVTNSVQDNSALHVVVKNAATGDYGWVLKSVFSDDSNVVHKTGAESIAGVKTFSNTPVFSSNNITIGSGQINWSGDNTFNFKTDPFDAFNSFSFGTGRFQSVLSASASATFLLDNITGNRNYYLQDLSGTLAMNESITLQSVTNTGDITTNIVHLDGGFDVTNGDSYFKIEKDNIPFTEDLRLDGFFLDSTDSKETVIAVGSDTSEITTYLNSLHTTGAGWKINNNDSSILKAISPGFSAELGVLKEGQSYTSTNAYKAKTDTNLLTADRNYQEPNLSGTKALVEYTIPITGTQSGNPVSGNIEIKGNSFDNIRIFQDNPVNDFTSYIGFDNDGPSFRIGTENTISGAASAVDLTEGGMSLITGENTITINSNEAASGGRGISGSEDYTTNITSLDYPQETYVIPRGGTKPGKPVTGDLEVLGSGNVVAIKQVNSVGQSKKISFEDDNSILIQNNDGSDTSNFTFNSSGFNISTTDAGSPGLSASQDYTANIIDLDYTQKKYVDNFVKYIVRDGVASAAVTGTTSETILISKLVPANTLDSDSEIEVKCLIAKTGIAGNGTVRIRTNTSNSLSGAITLGIYTDASTTLYAPFKRTFTCKPSNLIYGINNVNSNLNDDVVSNAAPASSAFDTTVDNWIIISVTPANSADSFISQSFYIKGQK